MATRVPIVLSAGEQQQLQSGDPLSPVSVGVLRVLDASYTMPANTSLTFINSLTLSNNVSFTIPSTSSVIITTGNPPLVYWDTYVQVSGSNFTTTSVSLVDITGLSVALLRASTYEFESVLICQSSGGAGVQAGVNFSASGASVAWTGLFTNGATTTTAAGQTGLNTGSTTFCVAAAIYGIAPIKGMIVTGANAGNLTIKLLSAGLTATCYIGSILKIKKLA